MFCDGQCFRLGKLQLIYKQEHRSETICFAVGVGKKDFRSSVQRNKVKRLLREVFRDLSTHHPKIVQPGQYFLLYQSSELPTYRLLHTNLLNLMKQMTSLD